MASIANPVSSLCSIPIKALPSSFGIETRFLVSSRSPEKRVAPVAGGFSGIELCGHRLRRRRSVESPAMRSADGGSDGGEAKVPKRVKKPNSFSHRYIDMLDKLHTVTYLCSWFIMAFIYICWFGIIRYLLSSVFSILTKELYNYFPFPYFVSVIHLLVGIAYWFVIQSVDLPLGPSPKPIEKQLMLSLIPVAACHALGYITYNVSVASVAVSFIHTITALEPFFNTVAARFVLNQQIPVSLWIPLVPVVIGVSMASLAEISFNWTGFISTMVSNASFSCRSIFYKNAKTGTDNNAKLYAYISGIALLFCIPFAVFIDGPKLAQHGFKDAVAKVGLWKLLFDLFRSGLFSHVYYRFVATDSNAERDGPRLHAVGNVLQRGFGIGLSIAVFGNVISTQTGIGTGIALAGVAIYNITKAKIITKEKREEAADCAADWEMKKDLAKRNARKNSK